MRSDGVVVFNRAVSRGRLAQLLADQQPCVVAMEACATPHHWGRVGMGHGPNSIPARSVTKATLRGLTHDRLKPSQNVKKNQLAKPGASTHAPGLPETK